MDIAAASEWRDLSPGEQAGLLFTALEGDLQFYCTAKLLQAQLFAGCSNEQMSMTVFNLVMVIVISLSS